MPKREITFQDIIDDVRGQLQDSGARIASAPLFFRRAWWPGQDWDSLKFQAELMSELRISSGPTEIDEEFFAEVKAIEECLDRLDYDPNDAKWQATTEGLYRQVHEEVNQRAVALSVWEKIAFPLRLRGKVVFHIVAPRDILGTPIVEAMPADEFVRRVSIQTVYDKAEISRLKQHLSRWRLAGVIATVVFLAFGLSIWSNH